MSPRTVFWPVVVGLLPYGLESSLGLGQSNGQWWWCCWCISTIPVIYTGGRWKGCGGWCSWVPVQVVSLWKWLWSPFRLCVGQGPLSMQYLFACEMAPQCPSGTCCCYRCDSAGGWIAKRGRGCLVKVVETTIFVNSSSEYLSTNKWNLPTQFTFVFLLHLLLPLFNTLLGHFFYLSVAACPWNTYIIRLFLWHNSAEAPVCESNCGYRQEKDAGVAE